MHSLSETAHIALSQCLELKKFEKVLIITNPSTEQAEIAQALHDEAASMGALPELFYQPIKSQGDFAEDYVVRAIEARPDVVLSISTENSARIGLGSPHRSSGRTATRTTTFSIIFSTEYGRCEPSGRQASPETCFFALSPSTMGQCATQRTGLRPC